MIRTGDLDQRIAIETPSKARNVLGEEVVTWMPAANLWAKVTETPGREFLKGDYHAEAKAVFLIRYRAMDSTARVTWRGTVYRIDGVTGTRRSAKTELSCTAIDGAT